MRHSACMPELRRLRCWFVSLGLALALAAPLAAQTYSTTPPAPSMSESISAGFKKIGKAFTPAESETPPDDPVALRTKAKPSCELYVAVARLYADANRLSEAETQYKKALKLKSDYLPALLGYAQVKDQMGLPLEALKLYHQAAKAHPREPSVYNNLAIHYTQRQMYREAVAALEGAVRLSPGEPKYRNNMASLLVEMGRPQEAFNQLRAVHNEAVAHYNLGYLLQKKGQAGMAAQQFALALQVDPSLAEAQQWLARLRGQGPQMMAASQRGGPPSPRGGSYGPPGETRMAARTEPTDNGDNAPLPPEADDGSAGGHVLNPQTRPPADQFAPPGYRLPPPGYGAPSWPPRSGPSPSIQRLPPVAPSRGDDSNAAPLPPL
jgi:Tfp pilus assembly protein PilF